MKQNFFSYSGAKWLLLLLVQVILSTCSNDDAPTNRIPQLSVNEIASNVTSSQATIEGAVTDNGSFISRCGFMVNTAKGVLEKSGIDEASVHEATRNASGNVKVELKNLKASTNYYYCLFVVSGNTPIKSSIAYFKTEDIAEPTLSAVEVVETGEDFVTLRCRLVNDGGQEIQSLGFDYKLADAQTFRSVTVEGFEENTTDLSFVCTINELEPGTNYDFRATAYNGVKYGYSSIRSIQTNAKTSPTVSIEDLADTNIGVNYVMVAGKIEDTGASDITERGFLISTVSNPTMATAGVTNVPVLTATDKFKATIDNLKPNTTYYVRAYAANNPYGSKTQYGYSSTLTFTTKNWETPSFSTITEQLVGINLKLTCTLDNKGINILERGFCYSSSNTNPDLSHQVIKVESEGETMEGSFQIQENTTYYIRPYVKYNLTGAEEISYGQAHTSKDYTFDRPNFTAPSHSDVTYNSAKLSATLEDKGMNMTKRGFKWGKSNNPTNFQEVTGSEFQTVIEGLSPGTTYYYQAYAEYELAGKTETVTSTVSSFTTTDVVQPTLGDVTTKQQQTKLSLSSVLTVTEDVTVTETGFCWSQSSTEPDLYSNIVWGALDENNIAATMTVEENATYYIRSYAKYSAAGTTGTVYSKVVTFTSSAFVRPVFTSVSSSDVTYLSATLSAVLTTNGVNVTKKYFKWGNIPNPSTELIVNGSEFKASLDQLTPSTKYYYRACIDYKIDEKEETLESDVYSFDTDNKPEPILGTVISSQSNSTLALSCIVNNNGVTIDEVGYCWSKTDTNPGQNSQVVKGTLDGGSIVASISVEENATYYIRSYAKYTIAGISGISYSESHTVQIDAFVRPSFSEVASSNVTYTTARLSATLIDNGVKITKRGFKWGKSVTPATDLLVSEGEFLASLDGLSYGTTYYFQAYAEYELAGKTETLTSTVSSFTTTDVVKPTLGDVTTKQQQTKLSLASKLSVEGDVTITEFGFCWSQTTEDPDVNSSVASGTMDEDNIVATIKVEENTRYYIRSYVKYNVTGTNITGTVYSNISQILTDSFVRPSFTEVTSSNVTDKEATLSALLSLNGATLVSKGFKWGTSSNPSTKEEVSGNEFKVTISNLNPASKYYFRAYVTYKIDDFEDTLESSVFSFETLSSPEPVLGTVNTNLQTNNLSLSCLLSDNGVAVTEAGFCWSKSYTEPTVANNLLVGSMNDNYIVASMSVEENTTYYLRAYAKYQALGLEQVAYSEVKSVTSDAFNRPSISNANCTDITTNSAKLSASITSNGVVPTSKGFKWGVSAKDLTTQEVTADDFVLSLTNLSANTTYYYQAYVTYKVGGVDETKTTDQRSFTTQSINAATVAIPEISNVGFREATVKATITDNGDGEVKKKGFVWSTSMSPTLENKSGSVELAADAEFTAHLSGLTDGTRYFVRAYVVTEGYGQTVTAYSSGGNDSYFNTPRMTLPSLATPTATEITQTTIKATASLNNGGNTDVTEMGFCWSDKDIDPAEMTNKSTVTADNFTLTITDTEKAGNTYYIYAYATNGKGTAYSEKLTATLKYIPGQGDNPHPDKE